MKTQAFPLPKTVSPREPGTLLTALYAVLLVAAGAWLLKGLTADSEWIHQFFFGRSFVQAVLLVAFAVGVVHLLRRLPAYRRERIALDSAPDSANHVAPVTAVGRRRASLRTAIGENRARTSVEAYARSLAEHDAAHLDSTYRIPSDVVQVLPLIGFFGTVLGLSRGLFEAYMTGGGTTPQDFAKAIAVAFDNTLLGLALTIILFIAQAIMRKRDEALLRRVDLEAADTIAARLPAPEPGVDGAQMSVALQDLAAALKSHGEELARTRAVFETPGEGLRLLVATHTTRTAHAVMKAITEQQKEAGAAWLRAAATAIDDAAQRLSGSVESGADSLRRACEAVRDHAVSIDAGTKGIATALRTLDERVAQLDQTGQESAASIRSAVVQAASETTTGVERSSQAVQERLQSLELQSAGLRDEVRRPRKMTIVESAGDAPAVSQG